MSKSPPKKLKPLSDLLPSWMEPSTRQFQTKPGSKIRYCPSNTTYFWAFKAAKAEFEKDYVVQVLKACQGNASQAARLAGKERSDFYALMRRAGISPESFRKPTEVRKRLGRKAQ